MNITLKGVIVIGISVWSTMWLFGKNNEAKEQPREFTAFQTSQPWKPTTDCRADVAIVYAMLLAVGGVICALAAAFAANRFIALDYDELFTK